MKKTLLARVLVAGTALTLAVPATAPVAQASEVQVPDAGLRKCLNVHLDQPAEAALTEAQLASIEELDCSAIRRQRHYNIRDLTGMEHLTGAQQVDLGGNMITELGPLSGLTQLQHLRLDRNATYDHNGTDDGQKVTSIDDLSPLAELTKLQTLDLYYSPELEDLSPLAELTDLRYLDLSVSSVDDISDLADMEKLEVFQANSAEITDVSALSGMAHLRVVELESNHVTDASPLTRSAGQGLSDKGCVGPGDFH